MNLGPATGLRITSLILAIVFIILSSIASFYGGYFGTLMAVVVICLIISLIWLILIGISVVALSDACMKTLDWVYHLIAGILYIVFSVIWFIILIFWYFDYCKGTNYCENSGSSGRSYFVNFIIAIIATIVGIVNGCVYLSIAKASR